MESKFLSLNWRDLAKGLIVAFAAALFQMAAQLLSEKGFQITSQDLLGVLDLAIKAAGGYLATVFFSDGEGKFLGKV